MNRTGRIAIATDTPGWHGKRLATACAQHGLEAVFVSLSDCRVDLEVNRFGIVMPGFERALPDGVLVREIAAGSFEQVTLRLGILHALQEWGVLVYNTARGVERTVDKSMTSMLLRRVGIATPPTCVSEHESHAREFLRREFASGHRVVVKPLFGSQGKGLQLLDESSPLPGINEYQGVHYLQRYVESFAGDPCDYRVFVVGGEAVAAMKRRGSSWVHNVAQGAICERVECDEPLAQIAVRAVQAVDCDYAGVDVMRDRDGAYTVLEVNGIPAWRGLQAVAEVDIAAALVCDFARRLDSAAHRAAS